MIIKPALDALTDLGVTGISFLSGCTVLSMSAVSLAQSRRIGMRVEPRRGTLLAVGGAVGGVTGKLAFDWLKTAFGGENQVGATQSAVLALLTAGVFLYVRVKGRLTPLHLQKSAACVATGLALGMLSSFLGIGGGPFNIAVLSFFLAMDSRTSALHSIYIIFFSQTASLLLAVCTGAVPQLPASSYVVMIAGGILGGLAGSRILRRLSNRGVDFLFSCILVVVTAISLYNMAVFLTA